jgi:hypothetical protein
MTGLKSLLRIDGLLLSKSMVNFMLIDIDSATEVAAPRGLRHLGAATSVAGRVSHTREPGFDPLDMKCMESWSRDFSPVKNSRCGNDAVGSLCAGDSHRDTR